MRYRLLALDIDGTLVGPDGSLPPAHAEAVQVARERGLEVVLVTGRGWRETEPLYRALGLRLPAVTLLGGQVVDGSGWVLREERMSRPAAAAVWQVAREQALSLVACMDTDLTVASRRAPDFAPWEQWNPATRVVGDLTPYFARRPPLFLTAYGRRAVAAVQAALPAGPPDSQWELWAPRPEETCLYMWPRGVSKGAALAALCRDLGVAPDEVVAMGDAPADLSMLTWAGAGVAMPGAPPEVRAACPYRADPGDPHPVATALRRLGIIG